MLESRRQALMAVVNSRFEAERKLFDERLNGQLSRYKHDLEQAETDVSQIKVVLKQNSSVAVVSQHFTSLGGSLLQVKERIGGVEAFMKEKGNVDKAIFKLR